MASPSECMTTACVGSGSWEFHPRMEPLSVAHMNVAERPLIRTNCESVYPTMPVGAPATTTSRDCLTPAPLYTVDQSLPLSDTHHGLDPAVAIPHPLTSLPSITGASPGSLDTRIVTR